jgi:hypothetical protein
MTPQRANVLRSAKTVWICPMMRSYRRYSVTVREPSQEDITMKKLGLATVVIGASVAVVLGFASPAQATITGASSAAETVQSSQAAGYDVQTNGVVHPATTPTPSSSTPSPTENSLSPTAEILFTPPAPHPPVPAPGTLPLSSFPGIYNVP